MNLQAHKPGAFMFSILRKDPIVLLAGLVLVLTAVPYFLPGLGPDTRAAWGSLYSAFPLLAICLLAFQFRLRRIADPDERRFWNLWTLALSAWVLNSLLTLWFDRQEEWTMQADLILNGGYFVFYSFVAIALETRPQPAMSQQARLAQVVERVGTLVFFFGLLSYFVIIPALLDPVTYESSSLLLFVALDFYLIVRLAGRRRDAPDGVWRRVYGWLLVTAVLWMITDTIETLMWAEVLPWVEDGSLLDLIWYPSYLTLVIAARAREAPAEELPARPVGFLLGSLVWFSVSFPVIHFTLTRLGVATPVLAPLQEILALVLLILLAAMVVIYARLMRSENLRLATERLQSQEKIKHLAYHDDLTGLPNRRLLADRMTQALSRGRRYNWHLAVLVVDVDNFKAVNDTLGHDAGDSILRQLAGRLRRSIRENDTVARLGGDEFVLVIEGLQGEENATRTTDFLTASLAAPYEVDGKKVTVTSTVGCAIFPNQGDTLEALLKEADSAMYRKKSSKYKLRDALPAAN
jgi:diguanylate cyclase (GGDEF)-like protein